MWKHVGREYREKEGENGSGFEKRSHPWGQEEEKKKLLISLPSVSVLPILQSLCFKLTLVIFYLFKTPKYSKYL